jgi:hypothetical protein
VTRWTAAQRYPRAAPRAPLGNLRWRLLCLTGLEFIALLTLMSAEFGLKDIVWPLAAPSYFERAAFPLYAIAKALLFRATLEFVVRPLLRRRQFPVVAHFAARRGHIEALVLAV